GPRSRCCCCRRRRRPAPAARRFRRPWRIRRTSCAWGFLSCSVPCSDSRKGRVPRWWGGGAGGRRSPADNPPVTSSSLRAAVVGGGPAGLMAAEVLAREGVAVDLFDAMPSVGRKFLLAGRG